MSSIIQFQTPAEKRQGFIFQVEKTRITTLEEKKLDFPSIVLCHCESGIPVSYPGLERWLYEMQKVEAQESETLRKKAYHLCSFLNYILWNTTCDAVSDVTIKDLRGFFVDFKTTSDGDPRDPQEWTRGITDVMRFMHNYVSYNNGHIPCKVSPEELVTPATIKIKDGKRSIVVDKANKLYVKPPVKKNKKYRLLLHGHLELLLFEARKYDPMLLPAIMLQAYAGLREGEVVNCTTGNISRAYTGFGRIGKIVIDLTSPAGFAEGHGGRTGFGAIKVPRRQEVYPDFIEVVVKCLDEHEALLQADGYPLADGSPLFYNAWGKPLSVSAYTSRLKKLFYRHFLPDLKKVCEEQGRWAENAPYIEAYELEYPGGHMLRHWFTMYLLQCTSLKTEEVSHWRGDADITSMADYIHVNAGFISAFREAVFTLQGEILEEVL